MSPAQLIAILVAVSLSAIAQYALKLGSASLNSAGGLDHRPMATLTNAALSPGIWLGLTIYAVSVLLWIWVLSKTDLSVAYPFVGISFILTMIIGAVLLSEDVSPMRIGGTILIAAGCIMVARTA
ncbi:MAG: EamA family transporter [Pseudomonadota bacterium]